MLAVIKSLDLIQAQKAKNSVESDSTKSTKSSDKDKEENTGSPAVVPAAPVAVVVPPAPTTTDAAATPPWSENDVAPDVKIRAWRENKRACFLTPTHMRQVVRALLDLRTAGTFCPLVPLSGLRLQNICHYIHLLVRLLILVELQSVTSRLQ